MPPMGNSIRECIYYHMGTLGVSQMVDMFVMYPIAWALFMLFGIAGFILGRGKPSIYLLSQLLLVGLVLFVLRDTFGAMSGDAWAVYAIGFASYIGAFLAGISTESMSWVVIFQLAAFMVTYLFLPWAFGFVGGA